MPAVKAPATVLVTGASGFLGAHVTKAFLSRGFDVRGTVRTPEKGDYLKNLFKKDYKGKFSYVIVKDISAPGAFDDAVKGVDAIAHTASPFEIVADDADPDVLIKPAVQGTVGVLKSAKAYGDAVRRIVVTSSVAAIDHPVDGAYVYTTDDWNDFSVNDVKTKGVKAPAVYKYSASKTLAERAVWDFVKENKGSIKFDAVATNTPFLYGPVIHEVKSMEKINTSTKKLWSLLSDPLPEDENTLADWVGDYLDVRDLAEAQVHAIEREELAGHRLILAAGPTTRQDYLDTAHNLGPALPKIPFKVPLGRPGFGDSKRHTFARFSEDSQKLLGMKLRHLPEVITDTLQSLVDKQLV